MKTHRHLSGICRIAPKCCGVIVLAVILLFGLSACGSKSKTRLSSSRSSIAALSKSGGYYKDDGPHANIPVNLDTVPEAVPRVEPFHQASLRPYTVMGQRFVPQTALKKERQRGHGSWYGKRFHGNTTSIGETYDMYAMTAAHPTLPLPSYARVTNVENGRSVIVRVNDRGPFLRERIMDLSYVAAYKLGYINAGSALIEVEPILHEEIRQGKVGSGKPATTVPSLPFPLPSSVPELPPLVINIPSIPSLPEASPISTSPLKGVFLQIGSFETLTNAALLFGRARYELTDFSEKLHLFNDGGRYRLQIGPFTSTEEARAQAVYIAAILRLQPFIVER